MSTPTRRVVVVGGSAAGLGTAEALRRRGFAGEVVVLEKEHEAGYERPPLSKSALRGEDVVMGGQLERVRTLGVELRYGVGARRLDVAERLVTLSDATTLTYDDLVIATGVAPRRLGGTEPAGVHVLRTHEDALGLRAGLDTCTSLVVIGAGFLGLEVAASARILGRAVTVLDIAPDPLADRLGVSAAGELRDRHRREGVRLLTGAVAGFVPDSSGLRVAQVELTDGRLLAADCVLVAIGSRPSVDWLADSGLDISDGVVCDEHCSAAPGVWAAGDVARWHHAGTGTSMRIEHRTNATEQAAAVAANILGDLRPFAPVPYFWTDQYDIRLQVAGFIPPGVVADREYVAGSATGGFVEVFRVDGRIVGVLAWNAAKALAGLRRQIEVGLGGAPTDRVGRENAVA